MKIVKYWEHRFNWGDQINTAFARLMGKPEAKFIKACDDPKQENILMAGSILQYADENSIVWGSGFLQDINECVQPKQILAVRGKLTRKRLLELGISCPEVYGDPVLLLPRLYLNDQKKRYKAGVIPHWSDPTPYKETKDVIIIRHDMNVFAYIDWLLSCEKIYASSLHGIICAEAYGIPAVQIRFKGIQQFKFDDYYSSRGNVNLDRLQELCPL